MAKGVVKLISLILSIILTIYGLIIILSTLSGGECYWQILVGLILIGLGPGLLALLTRSETSRSLDEVLLPDEELLAYAQSHWVNGMVPGLFLILVPLPILVLLNYGLSTLAGKISVIALPLIIILGTILLLRRKANPIPIDVVITNHRIIIRSRLLFKVWNQIEPWTTESILVRQSRLGKLLDYGQITIEREDGQKKVLKNISKPGEFSTSIRSHLTS